MDSGLYWHRLQRQYFFLLYSEMSAEWVMFHRRKLENGMEIFT